MPNTNVRFYSLGNIPSTYRNGSFLNLTSQDGGNAPGLYFCFNNQWRYLVNVDLDTWNCGEYDNSILKHMQHLKSSGLKYEHVLKSEIPDGSTVTQVSEVDQSPTSSSPVYVQLNSGNRWYYKLSGKEPLPASLNYGEIAVSYADGYERLFIKNSNNEIVEFEPAGRKNTVLNATFTNDLLTVDSSENECVWSIPYADVTAAGIGIYGAIVFLRENQTGKQLVPDVVFNSTDSTVDITLYSTANIPAGRYTAIVMGSNYNSNI